MLSSPMSPSNGAQFDLYVSYQCFYASMNFCNIFQICVPEHCRNGAVVEQELNRPTGEKLPADGKCMPCFLHAFDSLWLIQHRLVSGNAKVPIRRYNFHFKAFSVTTKEAVKNWVLQPNIVLNLRNRIF